MTFRAVGPVSAEFQRAASQVLHQIGETAQAAVRPLLALTRWELHSQPTPYHLSIVSPAPRPDEMLLGLFTAPPPTVCLFEQTIRRMTSAKGWSLTAGIRDVAIHELAQHRLGLNHMHEEPVARGHGNLLPFHP